MGSDVTNIKAENIGYQILRPKIMHGRFGSKMKASEHTVCSCVIPQLITVVGFNI
jgi:hypothetical protein